jgi:nucleoside-diphosphate-sugar epimerase
MKKVFITGISGTVGQYLFDELMRDGGYHLYCLVTHPHKLRFEPKHYSNVTIIVDDLKNISDHADILKEMDLVVHLAAGWGTTETNYDYPLEMFQLLDPAKCTKVINFSTASILGPDNKPIREAEKYGTSYIKGKYRFYNKLPELKIYPKVTTLFPTWVLGGDKDHRYSHAASGLLNIGKWLWLLRFFSVHVSFHFIHARDIARITAYLLKNETEQKDFVLGNGLITAGQFIKEACRFFKVRTYFQVPIPFGLVRFLAGHRLHDWDKFCMDKKHFKYNVSNAETFGFSSNLKTVEQILADLKRV